MELTPQQKLMLYVMKHGADMYDQDLPEFKSASEMKEFYYDSEEFSDAFYDGRNEVREGEAETKLRCEQSRYYESNAVAANIDGTWIGWTYWYGGGKHGEPESIDWIDDAYELDCVEEEKTVTVRTFTKKGE